MAFGAHFCSNLNLICDSFSPVLCVVYGTFVCFAFLSVCQLHCSVRSALFPRLTTDKIINCFYFSSSDIKLASSLFFLLICCINKSSIRIKMNARKIGAAFILLILSNHKHSFIEIITNNMNSILDSWHANNYEIPMKIVRNFKICEFVSEFAATASILSWVLPSCPGQYITPRMNISFKMSRNKLNIISFRNWPSVLPWGAPKSSERVSLFALFIIINWLRLLRKLLVSLLCYEFGHRDHIYIVFLRVGHDQ